MAKGKFQVPPTPVNIVVSLKAVPDYSTLPTSAELFLPYITISLYIKLFASKIHKRPSHRAKLNMSLQMQYQCLDSQWKKTKNQSNCVLQTVTTQFCEFYNAVSVNKKWLNVALGVDKSEIGHDNLRAVFQPKSLCDFMILWLSAKACHMLKQLQ